MALGWFMRRRALGTRKRLDGGFRGIIRSDCLRTNERCVERAAASLDAMRPEPLSNASCCRAWMAPRLSFMVFAINLACAKVFSAVGERRPQYAMRRLCRAYHVK